ncbi:hypothetical protein MMC27_003113 [Xylographa pallens]|nr:hypothetical protein [Xylographa pallens]
MAIHPHPQYWGSDCLEWRPSRSIGSKQSSDAGTVNSTFDDELTMSPYKGSFIAWSEGIRNCPGKNFSQVEVVATLATLFRDWRVNPVPEPSEDMDMARKRVMRMVEEDTGQVLLLQMLHTRRLRWLGKGDRPSVHKSDFNDQTRWYVAWHLVYSGDSTGARRVRF